jgi:hypothetical protein
VAAVRAAVRTWLRREYGCAGVLAAAACGAVAAAVLGGLRSHDPDAGWFASLWFAIAALLGLWSMTRLRRVWRLREIGEIDTLARLLDGVSPLDAGLRRDTLTILRHLLPRVDERDAPDFTWSRIATLVRLLNAADTPTDVRMAALSALRYVGNEYAAGQVAAMANGPAQTRDERALRRRARRLLPEMRERLEKRRAVETLLRPAAPPDEDMLLRPAEGAPTGDPTLLLRPMDVDLGDGCSRPDAQETNRRNN